MADSQKNKKKSESEDNVVDKLADKIVGEDQKIGKIALNGLIKKIIAILIIVILVCIGIFIVKKAFFSIADDVKDLIIGQEGELSSDSRINIVNVLQVNKLQTTKCNYSTILTVYCEDDDEEVDYHVVYDGTVITGVDLSEFTSEDINIDSKKNQIVISLPPTEIVSIDVDESSMEYILVEADEDDYKVFTTSYKLCKEDLAAKCITDEAFMSHAKTNTETAISGLLQPLIDQQYPDYTIVFE